MSAEVGVVIPAYRATKYIAEALESIFSQTFQDYEIIVVNDGCPDTENLERVLAPYQERIKYIKQENGGPATARNTAIRASSATFVAFLDSDDAWELQYLNIQLSRLRDDPSLAAVCCNARLFGSVPNAAGTLNDSTRGDGNVTVESLLKQIHVVAPSATVVKRQTIVQVGMFDEAIRGAEDIDLWLRILASGGQMAYQKEPLIRYRISAESLSASGLGMYQATALSLRKVLLRDNLSTAEREAADGRLRQVEAATALVRSKVAIEKANYAEARRQMWAANREMRSAKLLAICTLLVCAPWLVRWMAGRAAAAR